MDIALKNHFDRFMAEGKLPPELAEKEECRDLMLFNDKKLLDEWRNSRKGLWYQDNEGNVLHGGVDNILANKNNGKLIVLDYKTRGFPLKPNTHERYQSQLDTYTFLLQKAGKQTEEYGFLLFYYPKEVLMDGNVSFHAILKKMQVSPACAESLFLEAIALLKGDCPDETCEWCQGVSARRSYFDRFYK
jgi:hypothetical protein